MRPLDGVGVEYGTEWVIEHLIKEHREPIDTEEAYEELLDFFAHLQIAGQARHP
jgi:hypothetical protein